MKQRSDTWTAEQDTLLAETVLKHIREGSTQLKAFDEAGEKLSRTSAACGFRWNKVLRHDYTLAIQHAKKNRLVFIEKAPSPIYKPNKNEEEKKMKALGIIRKIDDLGRIVIPKEVRDTHGWKSGQAIEMFMDQEGRVLKAYRSDEEKENALKILKQAVNGKKFNLSDLNEVIEYVEGK
ncbi:MAG: hypothetical protein Q8898_09710 [Bacillota bacterium]|nr:hypothetical protein [Bacillota bacterium]